MRCHTLLPRFLRCIQGIQTLRMNTYLILESVWVLSREYLLRPPIRSCPSFSGASLHPTASWLPFTKCEPPWGTSNSFAAQPGWSHAYEKTFSTREFVLPRIPPHRKHTGHLCSLTHFTSLSTSSVILTLLKADTGKEEEGDRQGYY